MNLVDSCGWLEYFSDGPNASFYREAILDTDHLIVPTICIHEVFKSLLRQQNKNKAFEAVGAMINGRIVNLDAEIAMEAAKLGLENSLSLADSIIYASAKVHNAFIWTQDADFKKLPGVRYKEKRR